MNNKEDYIICKIETNALESGEVVQSINYFHVGKDNYKGNPIIDFNKSRPRLVSRTIETHINAFVKEPKTEQIINNLKVKL